MEFHTGGVHTSQFSTPGKSKKKRTNHSNQPIEKPGEKKCRSCWSYFSPSPMNSHPGFPRAMAPDQLEPCSFRPPLNGWWPRYTWQWHPRYRIGSPGNTSPNEVGMWQSNKKNGWFPQVSLFSLKSLVLSLSVEGKFPKCLAVSPSHEMP